MQYVTKSDNFRIFILDVFIKKEGDDIQPIRKYLPRSEVSKAKGAEILVIEFKAFNPVPQSFCGDLYLRSENPNPRNVFCTKLRTFRVEKVMRGLNQTIVPVMNIVNLIEHLMAVL